MVELTLLDKETVGAAAGAGDVVLVGPRGTPRHTARDQRASLHPSVPPARTLHTRVIKICVGLTRDARCKNEVGVAHDMNQIYSGLKIGQQNGRIYTHTHTHTHRISQNLWSQHCMRPRGLLVNYGDLFQLLS